MLEGGPELHRFSHILQNRKKSLFILGTTSLQGEQVKKKKKSLFRSFAPFSKESPQSVCLTKVWACCSLISLCLLLWITFLSPAFSLLAGGFST